MIWKRRRPSRKQSPEPQVHDDPAALVDVSLGIARAVSMSRDTISDRNTLLYRKELAVQRLAAGRGIEAVLILEHVVEQSVRLLGAEHPDTLAFRNELGQARLQAGQVAEAVALLDRNLADGERVLGPSHAETLTFRNNLAHAYSVSKAHERAIRLHQRNIALSEASLSEDAEQVLGRRNNLVWSYTLAGRRDEAIRQCESNVVDCRRLLGSGHPMTEVSRQNLAMLRDDRWWNR